MKSIKNIKQIFCILLIATSLNFAKANPIIPPPIISEIYFDNNNNWYIELIITDFYESDTIRLISNSDTAGIPSAYLIGGGIIVITQDSLLNPFSVNKTGDIIILQSCNQCSSENDWWELEQICWGNSFCNSWWDCNVGVPNEGQSLEMTQINYGDIYTPESYYWLVKNNNPSLTTNVYQVDSKGVFCGYVYDAQFHPISNVRLQYCSYYYFESPYANLTPVISDNTGYFYNANMFGKNYNITFCNNTYPFDEIIDTSIAISIEPDSVNYYEFILDTIILKSGELSIKTNHSISCYPNPFTKETTISFVIPENKLFSNVVIKIYNSQGDLVRILPVGTAKNQSGEYSVIWDGRGNLGECESGEYFYSLEIDGRIIASEKMMCVK
ncbi:MAG: T9SS type A sorting domain-containing protein [Bacteroidia bacterium]|nr:T9SS type A sorting domain-containing protein [Bacteroidia bacterium]